MYVFILVLILLSILFLPNLYKIIHPSIQIKNRIETDFLETKTNYEASKTENNFDYNEDSNGSMDYGDYPVKDDENIDIKEELPLKKKKEPIKR